MGALRDGKRKKRKMAAFSGNFFFFGLRFWSISFLSAQFRDNLFFFGLKFGSISFFRLLALRDGKRKKKKNSVKKRKMADFSGNFFFFRPKILVDFFSAQFRDNFFFSA